MRWRSWGLGMTLACLLLGGGARADILYQYQFDSPTYTVNAGGTHLVTVALAEFSTDGDLRPTNSVLVQSGLISAGVRIAYDKNLASVLVGSDITPNSDFANATNGFQPNVSGSPDIQSGSAALWEDAFLGPVVFPHSSPANGPFTITIGSFLFHAGTTGGTETLTALDFDGSPQPANDPVQNSTPDGMALDPLIANSTATITVIGATSIPEPGSLMLLSIGVLVFAARGWRRRR